jgi:glycine cleavage system protein P-like pyridoxal-binding family
MVRAYHQSRKGDDQRNICLIWVRLTEQILLSAAMAGMKIIVTKINEEAT